MKPSPIILLFVTLAFAFGARAARADERAEAERYFRTGERLLNAGEFAAAASSFEDAYEILPLPEIAFSAAQSYRLAYVKDQQPGRLKRAVELYRIYLDKVKSGGRVNDATNALLELEPQLQRLEAGGKTIAAMPANRTTGLMITSEVSPASGQIGADPALAGELPLVREVAAGKHEVTVKAKGYAPKTITAIAVEGELVPVEVDLEPLPATIELKIEGGARITIDGRSFGTTPMAPVKVDAGRHFVTVTKRGKKAHAREVVLERGSTATVATRLRTTTQRRAARWVLIGSGVLFVGAGLAGVGAWSADSDAADLDEQRRTTGISEADLARYEDLRRERDDLKTTMWTFGGAAVAVGVAGGLMYVFDRDEPEAAPAIAPVVGPDGAGVTVRGRF
jgi:stage V sporulation protein SpoVS